MGQICAREKTFKRRSRSVQRPTIDDPLLLETFHLSLGRLAIDPLARLPSVFEITPLTKIDHRTVRWRVVRSTYDHQPHSKFETKPFLVIRQIRNFFLPYLYMANSKNSISSLRGSCRIDESLFSIFLIESRKKKEKEGRSFRKELFSNILFFLSHFLSFAISRHGFGKNLSRRIVRRPR